MNLRDQFGLNIQRLRRERGISQEALAHASGINRGYIGKLENAKFAASVDLIERISLALNIKSFELFAEPLSTVSPGPILHPKKSNLKMKKSPNSKGGRPTKHRRHQAQLVREGVIFTLTEAVVVWQEYTWDNGEPIRYWEEGFETLPEDVITIRKMDAKVKI